MLVMSVFLLILMWGVSWLSGILLITYVAAFAYLTYSLEALPFNCCLSESGDIEINEPYSLIGHVSARSFYNGWVLFLCVEVSDKLSIGREEKHNKPKKWFVVFKDSMTNKEYRLLARLIISARWS